MKHWFSLTEDEKKARSLKCAFVMLIFAVMSLLLILQYQGSVNARIDKCTEETEGMIMSFNYHRYSNNTLTAYFDLDGRRYYTNGTYNPNEYSFSEKLEGGVPVKVWYEKGNPENAYANRPPRTNMLMYIFVVIFAIGFILFLIQAKSPKRMEERFVGKIQFKVNNDEHS